MEEMLDSDQLWNNGYLLEDSSGGSSPRGAIQYRAHKVALSLAGGWMDDR
eukprot:gene4551-5035_t